MWFLPTRNRPQACRELIEAMKHTETPKVSVMMDGLAYHIDWPSHWNIHQSDEHLEMQRALNALFKLYPNEPCYGLITDHSRPQTNNWASIMEQAAVPDKIVFANDTKNRIHPQTRKRRVTSASCYGGELVRKLGWVWLDKVTHMYGDDAWENIGHALGRVKYLPEVTVRDLLMKEGDIPVDENHRRLYQGKPYVNDDRLHYLEWLKDFPQLIERLR